MPHGDVTPTSFLPLFRVACVFHFLPVEVSCRTRFLSQGLDPPYCKLFWNLDLIILLPDCRQSLPQWQNRFLLEIFKIEFHAFGKGIETIGSLFLKHPFKMRDIPEWIGLPELKLEPLHTQKMSSSQKPRDLLNGN